MPLSKKYLLSNIPLSKIKQNKSNLGGAGGVWISRFPYLVLQVSAPFLSGSCLGVLFLLQKIAQCPKFTSHFSRLLPSLAPAPVHLPPPITPGFPRPVPLHNLVNVSLVNYSAQWKCMDGSQIEADLDKITFTVKPVHGRFHVTDITLILQSIF